MVVGLSTISKLNTTAFEFKKLNRIPTQSCPNNTACTSLMSQPWISLQNSLSPAANHTGKKKTNLKFN